ncbi:tagatose-6-phosphate ketose isomerase [Aliiroseovarius zhejiangensis]|uniref:Tagatose-6-phosphate ketose isomerase n=1 Tax=Aliiroseovarius zhejiangensis TaxID=1632025 RepID=A0ABQ3IXL8_9RHOB|nr:MULTISPECIES: tagatose-bisphosphate aldolase [Aliiroseovarius]MCK8485059.1 tagatose-bisphosphate aldolase [Aliiroseovarius sp. S2029]GHE94244.1 tagatose-6-phosphate ketose isomerase [Aliiroseovarius zhejiangensis]
MTTALDNWATWAEIHRQPAIWSAWGKALDVDGLRAWIKSVDHDEVWFCGAGTSAYIGDIIAAGVPGLRAVPSTDLVAAPKAFLNGVKPLVVSFGRSGNSTESIGTLDALDALAPDAPRLHITCNKDGALATRGAQGPMKVIVLPEATHDAGFAMTSSFSTMLLTALALFDAPCNVPSRLDALAGHLSTLLPQFRGMPRPERAVYVGAGPLAFAAREAALKVMELSAGQIPALWDSTLGFRHGPKSFVSDDTAITVFTSPDAPTRDYDSDLVAELRAQFPQARVMAVGPGGDIDIPMPFGPTWAAPLCVALAQVTGVEWAGALGLNVDDPFSGQGTLSRVVSGVKLYPVAS